MNIEWIIFFTVTVALLEGYSCIFPPAAPTFLPFKTLPPQQYPPPPQFIPLPNQQYPPQHLPPPNQPYPHQPLPTPHYPYPHQPLPTPHHPYPHLPLPTPHHPYPHLPLPHPYPQQPLPPPHHPFPPPHHQPPQIIIQPPPHHQPPQIIIQPPPNIAHPPQHSIIFETHIHGLPTFPSAIVTSVIQQRCSMIEGHRQPQFTPNIASLVFQLRIGIQATPFPLLHADQMWHSQFFRRDYRVVILITGWLNNEARFNIIEEFARAFASRSDVNFVVLDVSQCLNTLYSWSTMDYDVIANYLAIGLQKLVTIVSVRKIHLIGHSLGAHIAGAAGQKFRALTGQLLGHITGLDPAMMCHLKSPPTHLLARGDAVFVDIIHTSPGKMGIKDPMGDADFYVGCMGQSQPGCGSVICEHSRAWQYYVESIYRSNKQNFVARRCTSITTVCSQVCVGEMVVMGYRVSTKVTGYYYLEVNSGPPFGRGYIA